jgi:hypothetical protein
MAAWLQLDGIAPGERGDLVAELDAVIRCSASSRLISTVPR